MSPGSWLFLLLAKGADHLRLDQRGRCPLWYAFDNNPGGIYDDGGDPVNFSWELAQLHKLYTNRPRFMDEIEGVGSTLFDVAITSCASDALELLLERSGSTLWLQDLDILGLTPLAKMVLSLNVVLPPMTRDNDDRLDRNMQKALHTTMEFWSSEVKRAYVIQLSRPEVAHDLPDKDGKTLLCHALDLLYAEHCDKSRFSSLWDFFRSVVLTYLLLFMIEDQTARNHSNPWRLSHEGYSPLELVLALVDHFKPEEAQGTQQEATDAADSSLLSLIPDTLLSNTSKKAGSAESAFHAQEPAAEPALKAPDSALRLLETLEEEEDSESLECSNVKEQPNVRVDEKTSIGGRTKMKTAIQALRDAWDRKKVMEGKRSEIGIENAMETEGER